MWAYQAVSQCPGLIKADNVSRSALLQNLWENQLNALLGEPPALSPPPKSLAQNSFQHCSHSINAACLILLCGAGSDSTCAAAQVTLRSQACL